jgi:hypothetical protein
MGWFTVAVIATVVSAGLSATSMIMQGQQASAAAKQQSKLQDANAAIAANNALEVDKQTARELDRQRSEMRRLAGSQESAVAASGLMLTGSMLDVMSDSELQAELERTNLLRVGFSRATGSLQEAADFRAQASMTRAAGANALTNSYFGATGTLTSGLGQAAFIQGSRPPKK